MNDLLSDLSSRIQGALAPLGSPMAIRRAETIQCKVAAPAAIGATAIMLTVPAGITGLLAGDTFALGGTATKTVTTDAAASVGTVAVTFSPPLTAAIAAGALVQVNRSVTHACSGWVEGLDLARVQNTLIGVSDTSLCVLADGLVIDPKAGDVVTAAGRSYTIKSAARDGIGAVWRIIGGT